MAEALKRRNGTIKYTNLTRNLGDGDVPDTEFIYAILANVPSLENNQVYIQRDNIIDGDPSKFIDGVEVNFMPIKVSEEKFQAALDAGKPIRRYAGMDAVLASTSSDSSEDEQEVIPDEQESAIVMDKSKETPSKAKTAGNSKSNEKKLSFELHVSPSGDTLSYQGLFTRMISVVPPPKEVLTVFVNSDTLISVFDDELKSALFESCSTGKFEIFDDARPLRFTIMKGLSANVSLRLATSTEAVCFCLRKVQ